MFTFGIFTTHIPYIAMVAFYAYFLLFGVNKASCDNVQIADKSHSVQIHIDNSLKQVTSDSHCFYANLNENTETDVIKTFKIKQKWKHFGIDKNFQQEQLENILFGRPPPVLA